MAGRKGQGQGEAKNSPRIVRGIKREGQAIALRIAGKTMEEISQALDFADRRGAAEAIRRGLKRIVSQEVDEYRELMTVRLEKILETWWPYMINRRITLDVRLKVTDRILKAVADIRALHGTDLAKVPGSSPEAPLYVAPAFTGDLTDEQVAALIALDPGLMPTVIDQEGNDVGNGE